MADAEDMISMGYQVVKPDVLTLDEQEETSEMEPTEACAEDDSRSPKMAHVNAVAKESLEKETASCESNPGISLCAETMSAGSEQHQPVVSTESELGLDGGLGTDAEDVPVDGRPLADAEQTPSLSDCTETSAQIFEEQQQYLSDGEYADPVTDTEECVSQPDLHMEVQDDVEPFGFLETEVIDCTEDRPDASLGHFSPYQSSPSINNLPSLESGLIDFPERGLGHGIPVTIAGHELMQGTWGLVQCPFCTNTYNDPAELLEHQKSHAQEEQFECIDHEVLLAECQEVPGDAKTYQCIVCDRSFSKQSSLLTHLRIHTGEKPFSCHLCQKTFNQRTSLTVHLRTHTGEMPYSCFKCTRSFRQKSNLTHHMKSHVAQDILSYLNGCDGGHQRVDYSIAESSENPRWCHQSTVGGTNPKMNPDPKDCFSLQSAQMVRSKPPPFDLASHLETPTGKRPYTCSSCFKRFTHESNLIVHQRIHTGDRTYRCHECGKEFSRRTSLMVHIRTHTGEMPYQCRQCKRSFRQQSNLIYHLKTNNVHGVLCCIESTADGGPQNGRIVAPQPTSMSSADLIISPSHINLQSRPSVDVLRKPSSAMVNSQSSQNLHISPSGAAIKPEPSKDMLTIQSSVDFKSKLPQDQLISPSHMHVPPSEGLLGSSSLMDLMSKHSQEIPLSQSHEDFNSRSSDGLLATSIQTDVGSQYTDQLINLLQVDVKPEPPEEMLLNSSHADVVVTEVSQDMPVPPSPVDIKPEPPEELLITPSEFQPNAAKKVLFSSTHMGIQLKPIHDMFISPPGSDFYLQPRQDLYMGPLHDTSTLKQGRHVGKQPSPIGPPQKRKRGRPRKYVKPDMVRDGSGAPVAFFKCAQCPKYFANESNLRSHWRVHLGEKKHQCQVCGKRFGHRTSMMVHMRTHTGEMPFECKQCGRRFRQQSNLLYHHKSRSAAGCRAQGFGHGSAQRAGRADSTREHWNGYLGMGKVQGHVAERAFKGPIGQQLDTVLHHRPRGRPRKYFKFKQNLGPHCNALTRQRVPMGKRPYKCWKCPKRFNHKSNLAVHQRIHTGELPYHCGQCDRSFRQQSNLRHHQKSHEVPATGRAKEGSQCTALSGYQYAYNGVVTIAKEELISPLGIDITTGLYVGKESECDGELSDRSEQLTLAIEIVPNGVKLEEDSESLNPSVAEDRPFKCMECFKTFNHVSNLIVHQRVHTGDKTYQCHECRKHFSQRTSLMVHMRTHTGEMPYQCLQCKRSFRQQSNLIYHLKSRTVRGMLTCKEGEEIPSQAGAWNINRQSIKNEVPNEAPVDHLDGKLESGSYSGSGPSSIPEPRQTRSRERLQKAMASLVENSDSLSKEEAPPEIGVYKCFECCKSFTHKSNLIVHHRIHSGARCYQCQECSKEFSQRTSLMVHMRTHTGEMPFQCQQCDKSFRQQSNLIYHMKSHKTSAAPSDEGTANSSGIEKGAESAALPLEQDSPTKESAVESSMQLAPSLNPPHQKRPRGRPRKHVKLKGAYGAHRRELQCQ